MAGMTGPGAARNPAAGPAGTGQGAAGIAPGLPRRLERLYEGKAKVVYRTSDQDLVWIHFKDDATAFDGKKRGSIEDKGRLNALISARLFQVVEQAGVPTHFVQLAGERDMLARAVRIIPIEVVVRNVVAGSLARRLGLEEGRHLPEPVIEFYYKRDDLGDPLINRSHVRLLGLAGDDELDRIEDMALAVNRALRAFLYDRGLVLVDFKLEFGRDRDGRILLADEISPDTCRFWDRDTGRRLDKDRFRQGLGGEREAYAEVLRRVSGEPGAGGGASPAGAGDAAGAGGIDGTGTGPVPGGAGAAGAGPAATAGTGPAGSPGTGTGAAGERP
ncbi:MAG TPA: phosphoribosylaminoimidazolesuccinocarboxamide synthase [Thermaerobacter sp.]